MNVQLSESAEKLAAQQAMVEAQVQDKYSRPKTCDGSISRIEIAKRSFRPVNHAVRSSLLPRGNQYEEHVGFAISIYRGMNIQAVQNNCI